MTAPQPTDAGLAALKPCPFCGGHAFLNTRGGVSCERPFCGGMEPGPAPGLAIAAWNHRPSPTTGDAGLADSALLDAANPWNPLEGYRAAVSYISADSWDGCPDCIEILRAARTADWDWNWSPDEISAAIKRLRARSGLAQFAPSQPAPRADDALRASLPATVGRLSLGEQLSSEHYCGGSHDMPDGQPIYWQERGGEYPDDIDGFCLTCAIQQAESEAGWCDCSVRTALAASEKAP